MPKKTKAESVESIEKFLRSARKAKGLSLEDAARDTRVRKIYLKQFEVKVPDELNVYQIGYLRLYSRYLDVDIQPYLDARKASTTNQPDKDSGKKPASLASAMRQGLGAQRALVIALALVLALTSLIIAQWKKRSSPEIVTTSSTDQDVPSAQISSGMVTQTDRYTHILTNYSGKVKVVANIATIFTLLDPAHNNTIAKGALKAGEELPLPRIESVIIKTTIPDALDIQQGDETSAADSIKK